MSLKNQSLKKTEDVKLNKSRFNEQNPVFYFIYNTENYFHFIYDTLPYLITFNKLKDQIPFKLLINYPNEQTKHIYKFVLEFLKLVGIDESDLLYVNDKTIYDNIYVSSSYAHGFDSNLPPRKEVYDFFRWIVESNVDSFKSDTPKKIYISRRSWLHNDYSNIGTNYTLKRRMVNEDELVDLLLKNGYEEVFTEKLTTIEKLNLFYNAESVIGAIGGGLCNVLFSKKETNLLTIVSPTFLNVNYRFKYSLDGVNNIYFYDTDHTENSVFKTGMRVECESLSIVGEITEVRDDDVTLIYSDNVVAGWSNQIEFKRLEVRSKLCKKLDDGLNSPFSVNIKNIKHLIL
jgi:capsular polysaccharide biosynthesis protein